MKWPMVVGYAPSSPPHPQTRTALESYEPLYVGLPEDTSYLALLAQCWLQQETFIVVEPDVVPPPGFAEDLVDCAQDWCAFPYLVAGVVQPALGCTKFSGALTAATQGIWEKVAATNAHWSALDTLLALELQTWGYQVHNHKGEALHLNPKAPILVERTASLVVNPSRDA